MFPIAAFVVAVLSFLTTAPSAPIVLLFVAALVPWIAVLAGARLPASVVVLVTLAPTAWLAIGFHDQAAIFLAIVATAWTAALGMRWPSLLAIVGACAIAVAHALAQPDSHTDWVIWVTGTLFGHLAGQLLHRQRLLSDELGAARSELALAAVERERRAIAREVHDVVGHSLTVVLLNIAGARRHLATDPAAADAALAQAEQVGRESLDTVRSVVGLLHAPSDSQLAAPLPSGRDVVAVVEQAQRAGVAVDLSLDGDLDGLEPGVGLTVVRLLQESLANATRHAPGAPITIGLRVDADAVAAEIANPAARSSAAASRSGVGLASMTARVAALDGNFDAGRQDGRWVVRWRLPRHPAGGAPAGVADGLRTS